MKDLDRMKIIIKAKKFIASVPYGWAVKFPAGTVEWLDNASDEEAAVFMEAIKATLNFTTSGWEKK